MTAAHSVNAHLARRFFDEVWNEGRLDVIDQLVDPDFINFGRRSGTEGLKVIVAVWRTAFPDLEIHVEEELVADERVVLRVTCRGTHQGELRHWTMGVIPPTGRQFAVEQIHIFRLRNDRILEHWACRDDLGMLHQLGRIPTPEIPSELPRLMVTDAEVGGL